MAIALPVVSAVAGLYLFLPRARPALEPRHAPAMQPAALLRGEELRPLRIAMSAAFVSEQAVPVYDAIIEYLTRRSGISAELITGLGYATISQMLEEGAVDFGFICSYPYILAREQPSPKVELVAAPVVKAPRYMGKPIYFSDLIVHKDSTIRSIHDLKGRRYVYNEETSNSGYNMPRSYLVKLGLTNGFFGKVLRSGSHEESIRMVALGLADASFVDSIVLDFDRARGLGHAANVRVIDSIGPVGIVPFVVSTSVPAEIRKAIKTQLLTMHEDPRGRQILDDALLERFVDVSDSNYDGVRELKKVAEDAGFLEIK